MKNRITELFQDRKDTKLSVYFTAGFPALEDTSTILHSLQNAGVDFIEIGIPFSDPLADGPTIQASSQVAIQNGMSLKKLFEQLEGIRGSVDVPLILMGYLNPVLQFGMEDFVLQCSLAGIDGVILPDLPMEIYAEDYQELFESYKISFIPLITPATPEKRIRYLDEMSNGFIYMVSSHGITGSSISISEQAAYFQRTRAMQLRNPLVLGFGIQSSDDISYARPYCNGFVVGSAFIRHLQEHGGHRGINEFIKDLKMALKVEKKQR